MDPSLPPLSRPGGANGGRGGRVDDDAAVGAGELGVEDLQCRGFWLKKNLELTLFLLYFIVSDLRRSNSGGSVDCGTDDHNDVWGDTWESICQPGHG